MTFSEMFNGGVALNVLGGSFGLAVLSIFIWYFYRSISKRNLINLNLKKYNYSDHPLGAKFFAIVLYLVEYVIVMPLLIGLWFCGLALMLYLVGGDNLDTVLFASVVLIGAIRILAFYNPDIASELAKLFPFIALSVVFFSSHEILSLTFFQTFFTKLQSVSFLTANIFSYCLVVLGIEVFLRCLYTLFEFWESEEGETFNPME